MQEEGNCSVRFLQKRKDFSNDFPVGPSDAEEAVRRKESAHEHIEEEQSTSDPHQHSDVKADEGDTNEYAAEIMHIDAEKQLKHDYEEKRAFPCNEKVTTKEMSESKTSESIRKKTYSSSESFNGESIKTLDLYQSAQVDERREQSPVIEHYQHQYSGEICKHPAAPPTMQGKLSQTSVYIQDFVM